MVMKQESGELPHLGARDAGARHPVVPVWLCTERSIINGNLRLAFPRLSDQLNFGPSLLTLEGAEIMPGRSQAADHPGRLAYVRKEAITLAVDHVSESYRGHHPALREARQAHRIQADLGLVVVEGNLHLAHGADLGQWLRDGRLFVPLTDVTIFVEGREPHVRSMVIINRNKLGAVLS